MKPAQVTRPTGPIRFDDPQIAMERACQDERANWIAGRVGLPTIGSKLVNKHGIEWVVQNHATVPTANTLHRWRGGAVDPELDLYPVVAPQNFSPRLMEFFRAIDRCTTKTFAILDTMPGRRSDGHAPGGNSIDTVCHPMTNLLFLDAARVHETVIAHEFGHAWVQYVDECEDLRTMEDASDPQRLHLVSFVQSFVLDLKVNDLLRRKGFDMRPIEEDQARSLVQLASSVRSGYRPATPNEEVFMGLLVADEMIQREKGCSSELARYEDSLSTIRGELAPLAALADTLAGHVTNHGYDSHAAIVRCIDDCLIASFAHCGSSFDLDRELAAVKQEEPDIDKTPNWLPILPPKVKCQVGRHMALYEITSDWPQSVEVTVTARAKVVSWSPERDRRHEIVLQHRIGPPTRYSDLPEIIAENLAMKHRNQTGSYQLHGGPPHPANPPFDYDPRPANERTKPLFGSPAGPLPAQFRPGVGLPLGPGRNYMAGLGRFLTAARLDDQLAGEAPYSYALNNPIRYTDPGGRTPQSALGTSGPVVPEGSNFGQCAVYLCSEHSGIFSGGPIASHQYTCVEGPGGGCSGGLYPAGEGWSSGWGAGKIGNQGESCKSRNEGYPIDCHKVSSNCQVAAAICACNKKFERSPPNYVFPLQTCYTYINLLFDCACPSLSGSAASDCYRSAQGTI